jgi:hypothetical protein
MLTGFVVMLLTIPLLLMVMKRRAVVFREMAGSNVPSSKERSGEVLRLKPTCSLDMDNKTDSVYTTTIIYCCLSQASTNNHQLSTIIV